MNDPPRTKPRTNPDPRPTDIATEQRAREAENGPPDSARLPRANRSVQGQPQQLDADTNQPPKRPKTPTPPPVADRRR